jgi:purine nucleosidase
MEAAIRFIIDTDTAGDDVTSLLFGLRWPGIQLEAITVVAGNVYLDQAVTNALLTVEHSGGEAPVYVGADRPLLRDLVTAHYVHGEDGMGDGGFAPPKTEARTEHAVDVIVELCNRSDGEVEIIAQGPLTNIALAYMKDPTLPQKVKHLWVMGGANNSLGNITPAAEFNFYVDPEAAHMVLHAGFRTTIVPWDVCVLDGIIMRDELQEILDMCTPCSEFYLQANKSAWRYVREVMGVDGISHPDALTIAIAIDERVKTQAIDTYVDVEYRSELTRGYSLVDQGGVLGKKPNAEVVLRADKALFKDMLVRVLRTKG